MKTLISLAIALFSTSIFACTNFTGTYVTDLGGLYSIVQNDCLGMNMIDSEVVTTITFDSVEQRILDVQVDEEIPYRLEVFISGKMVKEKWVYNERAVKTYATGPIEVTPSFSEVYLDEKRDLITMKHLANGTIEAYVDVRVKSL